VLLGVSALALYAACYSNPPKPVDHPPWHIVWIYRLGQGLIVAAVFLATVGAATVVAWGALRALRGL
jgi:hypothetical protein